MTESKPSVKLMSRPEFQHLRPVVGAVQREVNERGGDCRVEDLVPLVARHLYDAAPTEATESLREGLQALQRLVNDAELTGLDEDAGWDAWLGQARHSLNRLRQTPEGRALLGDDDVE